MQPTTSLAVAPLRRQVAGSSRGIQLRIGIEPRSYSNLCCRPRERGDPVNAIAQMCLGIAIDALEYWVPAFAGTTPRYTNKDQVALALVWKFL